MDRTKYVNIVIETHCKTNLVEEEILRNQIIIRKPHMKTSKI